MLPEEFCQVEVKKLSENPFYLMDDEWMLITAGSPDHFNMMTASWGTLGILWNKPVALCFIRPQRYTRKFADESSWFTLCFFPETFRDALNLCGSKSGRHIDKVKETGLTPVVTDNGNIIFREARLALECRKIYHDDFKASQFDVPSFVKRIYPTGDFHRFYIGEIVTCFQKK